jgi:hypothetical protein
LTRRLKTTRPTTGATPACRVRGCLSPGRSQQTRFRLSSGAG